MKILTLLFVVAITLIVFNTENNSGRYVLITIASFVYIVLLMTGAQMADELKSFESPLTISQNEFGKKFRIAEIQNGRVGLIPWGSIEFGLGDKSLTKTYYWSNSIPNDLLEEDTVFIVKPGFKFKKIQVNGYGDKTKKPYEELGIEYSL